MKKAFLIGLLLLLALFAFSCKADAAEDTALRCGGDVIVSCSENGFSFFGGSLRGALSLENDSIDELEITVFSENGKSATLCAQKGGTAKARSPKGSLAAITIKENGDEHSYAVTKKGLELLLSSDACSITIADYIYNEGNLIINRPVSINAASALEVGGDVYYITDSEGTLKLDGSISADKFACSAPFSDVCLPEKLLGDNVQFYLNAKSVNGDTISSGERIVTTLEQLEELCALPEFFIPAGETVALSKISFTKPFTIPFACKLRISEDCILGGNLTVTTEEKGEIRLFGQFDYTDININAPNCSISWDNPCTLSEASKHFNALSLNGYRLSDYSLGGKGKFSILSAKMTKDGALSSCDIQWEVEEKTLVATVNGVVAPSALKNSQLEFELNGGKVEIDPASRGENGGIDLLSGLGAYVTVTDNSGNTKKYQIITEITSKLPVVVIETKGNAPIEDNEEYINATLALECDFSDGFESAEASEIEIRGRGNSTWKWFDKKPYKIRYSTDVSLLGLCEGKEWVLLANYADKSLMRNYVALESAKVLTNMDCYATQYPVDVFLNGKYAGVYSLGEQIEADGDRVSIHQNATSIDTGFFLEIGGTYVSDGPNSFSTDYMSCVEILEPSGASLTEKHKAYITGYFSAADKAVGSLNGYENFIDVDSLIDWLILTELSFNSDGAMRRSVFMKKDHDGMIKLGPVWDFDIAYGNSETDYENYEAWCCTATDMGYVYENWICRLMKDDAFVQRLAERWNEIKDSLYECSMDTIDYGYNMIAPSADANFERWDILTSKVTLQPDFMLLYNTYEKQVDYLRDFITKRFQWIDGQLNPEENSEKGATP